MKPERWHQIKLLYSQALEVKESHRSDFLREACAGDDDLRQDLEELFAEDPETASFLETPALREIAPEFAAASTTASPPWIG